MNIQEFVAKHRIATDTESVNSDFRYYRSTIYFNGKKVTVILKTDCPRNPTTVDVLATMIKYHRYTDVPGGFVEWARRHDYNPDSRAAEQLYRTCKGQTKKLCRLLGLRLYQELIQNSCL